MGEMDSQETQELAARWISMALGSGSRRIPRVPRSLEASHPIRQMGDRRGRLKRQSARVSGQGSQNLYPKLQFLRDFW